MRILAIETWKDVKDFENIYQISNKGNIRALNYNNKKGCVQNLKVDVSKQNGYCYIRLCNGNTNKHFRVHRLVAEAFIPNPDNLPQVNHKDENKQNNCVDNLEWCSQQYNMNYGTRIKRGSQNRKKGLLQLDLHNNILQKWTSGLDAQEALGIQRSHISQCCNNKRKTAGGYKWRWCE